MVGMNNYFNIENIALSLFCYVGWKSSGNLIIFGKVRKSIGNVRKAFEQQSENLRKSLLSKNCTENKKLLERKKVVQI